MIIIIIIQNIDNSITSQNLCMGVKFTGIFQISSNTFRGAILIHVMLIVLYLFSAFLLFVVDNPR